MDHQVELEELLRLSALSAEQHARIEEMYTALKKENEALRATLALIAQTIRQIAQTLTPPR